ncbi:trypsin-like serine protease [Microthyrium microscopicum]|uniref:Serine protease n=1 Tax=Microthyrium microscopicum TaxID=703497 RepID=A0A6A6TY09_9PEZI|nr:trypsin-like serine protease [Microthyrium microscopicum]
MQYLPNVVVSFIAWSLGYTGSWLRARRRAKIREAREPIQDIANEAFAELRHESGPLTDDSAAQLAKNMDLPNFLGERDYTQVKTQVLLIEKKIAQFVNGIRIADDMSQRPYYQLCKQVLEQLKMLFDANHPINGKAVIDDNTALSRAIQKAIIIETGDLEVARTLSELEYGNWNPFSDLNGIMSWEPGSCDVEELISSTKAAIESLQYACEVVQQRKRKVPDFQKSTIFMSWPFRSTPRKSKVLTVTESADLKQVPVLNSALENTLNEALFGKRPRVEVADTDFAPGGQYRGRDICPHFQSRTPDELQGVCKLFIKFQNQKPGTISIGSGWCIGKDTVVTAAHCLYDSVYGRYAQSITAHIGYSGKADYAITKPEAIHGISAVIHEEYHATGQTRYDMAFVRLEKPFKDVIQIIGEFAPLKESNVTLRIVGYPGDSPSGHKNLEGEVMFSSEGLVQTMHLQKEKYELRYDLDTVGGNSGSPVLKITPGQSSFRAIGTHCAFSTLNKGSALGHEGHLPDRYEQALKAALGKPTTNATVTQQKGSIPGLQKITITDSP